MDINDLGINALRCLSMDAINNANSGHPGICLGAATLMHTLFTRFLKATPQDSTWLGRDRFVLAAGHGSALLYSMLHICGYKVSLDDLYDFRQLNSVTPGHPEYGLTDGVDCTSGPLGQGIAHAVGLAMAEKRMGELFNRPDVNLFDNHTYVLCGDGDIQEGVTQEAISLAATLKLNKLIVIYDANDVTLDGALDLSFSEDVEKRFKACGWNVLKCDGLVLEEVERCLKRASRMKDAPTLIIARTVIGFGSSKQGTSKVHGSPLGAEETDKLKKKLTWPYPPFKVPDAVYDYYQATFVRRGLRFNRSWKNRLKKYKKLYPEDHATLMACLDGSICGQIVYPQFELGTDEATRATSGKILNEIAKQMPNLFGGASDVASSVNTTIKNAGAWALEEGGRNIYFGIREFAMSCAQTGLLLYGGLRTYVGCFLVFSDYLKPSIRTAALMNVPSINVFTHDSIAVGEDGPTHQPIEQISSLRLVPNTVTIRPAGAIETAHAWRYAIENKEGPVNLILSRQKIKTLAAGSYEDFVKGGYVVKEVSGADYTLLATGSEVPLALKIADLVSDRLKVRVASIPSLELFNKQSKTYQNQVTGGKRDKTIAIEMGVSGLWYRYADKVVGIDEFGCSAKGEEVIAAYGFTAEELSQKLFD